MEVYLHSFLTSAIDGDGLSVSCSGHFPPGHSLYKIPNEQETGWTPVKV